MRTDTRTTTEADAGWFEMQRGGGYSSYRDDQPSAAELAEDAFLDRQAREMQQRRDDAARARGDYVPSVAMRSAASTAGLALVVRGVLDIEVTPTREGVLWVNRPVAAETLAEVFPADRHDVRPADGGVWVAVIRTPLGDPFLVDGVAQDDGPPF